MSAERGLEVIELDPELRLRYVAARGTAEILHEIREDTRISEDDKALLAANVEALMRLVVRIDRDARGPNWTDTLPQPPPPP